MGHLNVCLLHPKALDIQNNTTRRSRHFVHHRGLAYDREWRLPACSGSTRFLVCWSRPSTSTGLWWRHHILLLSHQCQENSPEL